MDTEIKSKRGGWGSNFGFLMASIGSAVGLGNIWGFPYKMGKSGGAVFLLLYLVLVVLVGVTVMLGELALGRRSGKSAVSTYRGLSKKYTWLGYAGIVCGFCIMCFYFVLGGIVLRYAVGYFLAIFGGSEFAWSGQGTGFFGYFLTDTNSMILFFVLYILLNILVVSGGVQGGIEKFCNVGMPALFCLLVFIILYIACQPGAAEGYKFMFTPRWEALKDPMIWIWAMGQAFFSLSVTGSGMIVYGAYLSKDEDVVGVAQHTAIFDTIAAVVAALVIIPACFSYGLDVGAGPSLLFVTLPTILQDIPLGRLFAVILYVAMIFAGVSSLQNMFEAVAESLLHKFPKLSRAAVLGILCVLCLGFGLLMEPISKWGPWMDLVSIYIIPIGATLGAISWFYVMKKDELLAAVNTGSKKERGALWYNVGRFVYVPLAVILCCVALFMHVAF